jgi:ABC-2 type transport system permease protein
LLLVAALDAVPAATRVFLGTARDGPALGAAGVVAGAATGGLLYWWGGRLAARRLADRGAELLDLLRLGPQEPAGPGAARPGREPAPQLSRARSAARGTLLTVGILCVVPQGLVPLGFNLFGVDPQVRVWFAARYLPQPMQVPAAVAFIVVGALALWWAAVIQRGHAGAPKGTDGPTAPAGRVGSGR